MQNIVYNYNIIFSCVWYEKVKQLRYAKTKNYVFSISINILKHTKK